MCQTQMTNRRRALKDTFLFPSWSQDFEVIVSLPSSNSTLVSVVFKTQCGHAPSFLAQALPQQLFPSQRYFCGYLTNKDIQYLRGYLHPRPEIMPAPCTTAGPRLPRSGG